MIDTLAKRCSAIATRRLPWFRRFAPIPDGSMDQGDRQHVAFVYRGIDAGAAQVVGTLIGVWSNPITVTAFTGPITARAETKVEL